MYPIYITISFWRDVKFWWNLIIIISKLIIITFFNEHLYEWPHSNNYNCAFSLHTLHSVIFIALYAHPHIEGCAFAHPEIREQFRKSTTEKARQVTAQPQRQKIVTRNGIAKWNTFGFDVDSSTSPRSLSSSSALSPLAWHRYNDASLRMCQEMLLYWCGSDGNRT